jgi:hypothetical protein
VSANVPVVLHLYPSNSSRVNDLLRMTRLAVANDPNIVANTIGRCI